MEAEMRRFQAFRQILLAAALATCGAGPALAETPERRDESRGSLAGRNGLAVTIGVGAMDFLGRAVREALTDNVGLYADLRVVYRTRCRVGVEAAFTRSQRHLAPGWVESKSGWLFAQSFEAS